ncbi:TDIF1-like protein [Mya arenaria]|uniref:TDIF1-like protein n=1 Tax=Mya arenaria TaxID=6604 RepID=A0ABY7E580_MYAAR|nr:TDIF1-like protein [Mya arenaria]
MYENFDYATQLDCAFTKRLKKMASRKNEGRRSVSPARTGNMRPQPSLHPSPPSMNILSSILRAPHPNLQHAPPMGDTSQPGRGISPIRVITAMPYRSTPSPKGGLSPSRVPTTLPPKKSLSPSRTIYVTSTSPKPQFSKAPSPPSAHGSQGQTRQLSQGQLLSHLPYLAQTLQQGGLPHERIFHQYRSTQEAVSGSMTLPSNARGSPGSQGQTAPLPAHQRVATPPLGSGIRRTPSPAHMPVVEIPAKHLVEHSPKVQAVNLMKIPEQDFKFGDLLQSINRSQEQLQSQLMQSGLSPITPADQLPKQWALQPQPPPNISLTSNAGQFTSSSQGLLRPTQSASDSRLSMHYTTDSKPAILQEVLGSGGLLAAARSIHQSTSTASHVVSHPPASGFTPVVLPSQSHSVRSSVLNPSIPVISSFVNVMKPTLTNVQATVSQEIKKEPQFVPSSLASVTQPGPPNITISTRTNMPSQEKLAQRLPRNPFTFPATPPASLTNEKPAFVMSQSNLVVADGLTNEKQRHASDEMPKLSPVGKLKREKDEEEALVPLQNCLNMRMVTLSNFPNNPHNRPSYRATSVAIDKAKVGCITNSAKSMDILRQNLQKAMNKEIDAVIQSYMEKYFKLGIQNIRMNNGETAVTDDHIQAVCRQILEEAKKMYIPETGRRSVSPARELSDNVSETGSSGRRSALGRRRHPSDTDSEASLRPAPAKKKKGRPYIVNLTGRSTPSKLAIQQAKREGPKYDPERLTEDTQFVMGSKANKAMGFGATRGRLYMKHPDLYKYSGDQDDKTWLYEHHFMPATGGKSYLVVLDDIREIAISDEYKEQSGIVVESLVGFNVPMWMIEKMRLQMNAMRTDLPKATKYRSRSATPNVVEELVDDVTAPKEIKDLPFANFSSPKNINVIHVPQEEDEMDFLATGSDNRDTPSQLSPFNMTGGFDDATSQSDLDTLDDDPTFTLSK